MRQRLAVIVRGTVQDAGFLAFVYRMARARQLSGFARPAGPGVEIEIEGELAALQAFMVELRRQASPPARLHSIDAVPLSARDDRAFVIGMARTPRPDRMTAWSR